MRLPHQLTINHTIIHVLYSNALCVPVCGFMRASHFPDHLRCASAAVATTGGKGVGVTFLSGGGERVWSNVKIITSGGREIERED